MSLELYEGSLPVEKILSRWYNDMRDRNYGAFIPFVGIVRDEDGISGLSFDIYGSSLPCVWPGGKRCSNA